MKRIVLIVPILFFGIIAIINLGGSNNGCYTMANGLFGLLSSFITVIYTIIITLISAYWWLSKKDKFNFLPISTFAAILIIFLLINYFENKVPVLLEARINNNISENNYKNISITLHENSKFQLKKTGPEYGCIETGRYQFKNDTLILFRGKKHIVKGFDYTHFLINRDNKIIMIINEHNEVDTIRYFNIE